MRYRQFSVHRRVVFAFSSLLVVIIVLSIAVETVVRLQGHRSWQPHGISVQVHPGGKYSRRHPTLGYSTIPGSFTVTLYDGYSFKTTHLPNTLRITKPLKEYRFDRRRPGIWIFGGSFTYGATLDDEETYPWLLQERLPQYDVVNFGVNGYGTIHSLIQFREALETQSPPEVAIVAYGFFHDERNTFLRIRRKAVAPWNKLGPLVQPYARIRRDGMLDYFLADVEYREFPLMRYSAFVHYLEQRYNQIEDRYYHSHQVSRLIITEMHNLAMEAGCQLVVAGIYRGSDAMLNYARRGGLHTVDISVDLSEKSNNNLPHDAHPSALANEQYADKLEAFLRSRVLENRPPL